MAVVDVEERYRNYFRFLNELYDVTDGSEIPYVSLWEIGKRIGTGGNPSIETQNIYKWLVGEGLVKGRGIGGDIGLTHSGIREVEDARRYPDQPTGHFPPNIFNIINNYGTMNNPAIQQGGTNYVQNISISMEQHEKLSEIMDDLRNISESAKQLTVDEKSELQDDINMLEIQVKSKNPNKSIIRTILSSAKDKIIKHGSKIVDGAIVVGKITAFLVTLV